MAESKLPIFLQGKSCFDGRESPSIPQDFLKRFYSKNKKHKELRTCPMCGTQFYPKQMRSQFCGYNCRNKYRKRPVKINVKREDIRMDNPQEHVLYEWY